MQGPLARYTTAASIIPNYNNKCKSEITTREPGNKVSPDARFIRVRDLRLFSPVLRSVNDHLYRLLSYTTNKLNGAQIFRFPRDMSRVAFDKINTARSQ